MTRLRSALTGIFLVSILIGGLYLAISAYMDANPATTTTTSTTTPIKDMEAINAAYCRGVADGVQAQLAYEAGRIAFLKALGFDPTNMPPEGEYNKLLAEIPNGDKEMAQAAAEVAGKKAFDAAKADGDPEGWCQSYLTFMARYGYEPYGTEEKPLGGGGEPVNE